MDRTAEEPGVALLLVGLELGKVDDEGSRAGGREEDSAGTSEVEGGWGEGAGGITGVGRVCW